MTHTRHTQCDITEATDLKAVTSAEAIRCVAGTVTAGCFLEMLAETGVR